jgi:ABC-type nitrate/sulfonate/bicarbonate transport system substrate-binding protein
MKKLLSLLCAALLIGAACSSGDDGAGGDGATTGTGTGDDRASEDLREVTLVLDWTPNTNHTGIYVAQAEGYYEEAGLDVEIIQPGESGSLQALGSGNADFVVSVQEQLVPARLEGVPAVSVAAIVQHNTSSLMALGDEGIVTPADLEGRRYGGFGGDLERELVESLVECDGGDPSAVEFVEVGNVDYRVGLEQDRFDFVWVFDGWDVIRLEQVEDVDVATIPFDEHLDCIPDWYTPLLATSEQLIADDPETVRAFVEATARGYAFAAEKPEEAAQILLEAAPELDPGLVEPSAAFLADQYAADAPQWGWQDEQVWVDFSAFLLESGLIEEELDVSTAYTTEFLPEDP